jgi:hypothetical protein
MRDRGCGLVEEKAWKPRASAVRGSLTAGIRWRRYNFTLLET